MLLLCSFAVARSNSRSRTCSVVVPPGTVGALQHVQQVFYGCFWAKRPLPAAGASQAPGL